MHSFQLLAGLATVCLILTANFYIFFQTDFDVTSILPLQNQEEVQSLRAKNSQLEHALEFAKAKASSAVAALSSTSAQATADLQLEHTNAAAKLATSLPYAEDASSFAYIFYATQNAYACSALVNLARLHALNSTLAIHVLLSPAIDSEYQLAFAALNTTIHILPIPHPPASTVSSPSTAYYANCWLKLVAFRMHHLQPTLKRVLVLDADQLIFHNLDNLFTGLPAVDLVAPRAYWLRRHFLSTTFMLINLSDRLWDTVNATMQETREGEFDMDLVNRVLGNTSLVLGGEYAALNFHWETWGLPNWYHSNEVINWTTVNMVNGIARDKNKAQKAQLRREVELQQDTASSALDTSSTIALAPPLVPPSSSDPASAAPRLPPSDSQIPILPRFPATHPLSRALHDLKEVAPLIHFTAVGKPWQFTAEALQRMRPDAHPGLAELVEEWRMGAAKVCPRWNGGAGLGG